MMTDNFLQDFESYFKASYPILWIASHEEDRVISTILSVEGMANISGVYKWDSDRGLTQYDKNGSGSTSWVSVPSTLTLKDLLTYIEKDNLKSKVYILQDFHPYLEGHVVVRRIRNLIPLLKARNQTIVILSPVIKIPVELDKDIQLVEFPLPTEDALEKKLTFVQRSLKNLELPKDVKYQAIEAAKGMTINEAENAFTVSVVKNKAFNNAFVQSVFEEKITQVKKSGLLTYLKPDVTFDQVGGLKGLKNWIKTRARAYEPEARTFGLPFSRGVLLAGISGVGKTLVAKAASHAMQMPLFQLDVGSLFGSLVGQTESRFRQVIQTADAVGRCIIFIDEIERALNNDAVSGRNDGGTSSRSFGTLLSWLSDHTTPVFVIGTSNNFLNLPIEFLRKGRFSELFFIDLPDVKDRLEIWNVVIKKFKRDPKKFNVKKLAEKSEGFTGAEIEDCFISAMYYSYAHTKEDVNTEIVLFELETATPQSVTNKEEIDKMREQAKDKLRKASDEGLVRKIDDLRV